MAKVNDAAIFAEGDWWDKQGAFRALHDINPLRLRWLQETAGELNGKKLLDFGCGGGIFAEAAAAGGAEVVGIDAQARAIAAAQEHARAAGLDIVYRRQQSPMEESPGQYDIVTCFEVLEHIASPAEVAEVVAGIAALLKPGGVAAFSTINRTLKAWLLMIAGMEGALKILPTGTHRYSQFISPAELAAMCRRSGLSVRAVTGMTYSFFGRLYRLTENDTDVNYFMAARRRDD